MAASNHLDFSAPGSEHPIISSHIHYIHTYIHIQQQQQRARSPARPPAQFIYMFSSSAMYMFTYVHMFSCTYTAYSSSIERQAAASRVAAGAQQHAHARHVPAACRRTRSAAGSAARATAAIRCLSLQGSFPAFQKQKRVRAFSFAVKSQSKIPWPAVLPPPARPNARPALYVWRVPLLQVCGRRQCGQRPR